MSCLSPGLAETLRPLAALLRTAEQPWWIIGSMAVALHGGDPGHIRDVDVVLDESDARHFMDRLNLPNLASSGDPLFRSDLFSRWTETLVPVEFMAGLKVRNSSGWQPLVIHTREQVSDGLFIPSRDELRNILTSFGRDKDLRRAASLA